MPCRFTLSYIRGALLFYLSFCVLFTDLLFYDDRRCLSEKRDWPWEAILGFSGLDFLGLLMAVLVTLFADFSDFSVAPFKHFC